MDPDDPFAPPPQPPRPERPPMPAAMRKELLTGSAFFVAVAVGFGLAGHFHSIGSPLLATWVAVFGVRLFRWFAESRRPPQPLQPPPPPRADRILPDGPRPGLWRRYRDYVNADH